MIGVYMIKNKLNGKVYIGQSKDIKRRFREYANRTGKVDTVIHRALEKHGVDAFEFSIIQECGINELDKLEIEHISNFKSNVKRYGYNVTNGGKGYNGKFTKTHRRNMSESKIGENNPNYGKSISEITRARRSESLKGIPRTEEWKAKISESQKGKIISPEVRVKISNSLKGKKHSDSTKEKLRISSTGRKHTDEAKLKISESKIIPVYQYGMEWNLIKRFESMVDASADTGVSKPNICNCCKGNRKSAGGFRWSYNER